MGENNKLQLNDEAWEKLFEKYNIEKIVESTGMFEITATQIKEFREPRLMTKFDTKESLPKIFKKMTILPNSRGSYLIGHFDTYADFPPMEREIHHFDFPDYLETLNREKINSEANAINALSVSSIIDDFLEDDDFLQTISGKMSSGIFDFNIYDRKLKRDVNLSVNNSQIEIDAGFENRNYVCIVEGKNVVHNNFIVRQLYYPVRCWSNKITKSIRPVFMVYSNNIFRLMEFEFTDINTYSSIRFLRQKNYSFEDIRISMQDLMNVYYSTSVMPEPSNVPFLQANSFNTVISLLEMLSVEPLTSAEIAENIGFDIRQADYYYNAARYLGLTEKVVTEESVTKVQLTKRGRDLFKLSHKKRQLKYVAFMMEHEILRHSFKISVDSGNIPDKFYLATKILELRLCSEGVAERRASTVAGWTKWIFDLVND